jgi:hypothetical protein
MAIFSERLDKILIDNGFFHSTPSLGKGNTFDFPIEINYDIPGNYERRIRVSYGGFHGYSYSGGPVEVFCMDMNVSKEYKDESEITEEQIKAFIELCKNKSV